MSLIPKSPAGRAYTRRIAIAMTLYIVCLFITVHRLAQPATGHVTAVLLSILPSIPILAVIVIVGLYLKQETDEFQRALLTQAMLYGMGGTLAVTSVWGFLETFHQAPHFPAFYVFVLFWLIVGLAGCVQRFYYRGTPND